MLITSRTPLRVSFFGGGTDYPEYFSRFPGAVVGMAINKYIYISALRLATFIDYKYRLSYSRLENTTRIEDIQHPVIREVLKYYKVDEALDMSVIADLPASSGLGSSSAFTVGLINLVKALKAEQMTRLDLGLAAIHAERELLNDSVGVQDQLHAAFGGLNRFDFVDGRIRISPVQMHSDSQNMLLSSLVLIYTGIQRSASATVKEQIEATRERKVDRELGELLALTTQAVEVLEGSDPERMLATFGAMMHEGWMIKRSLSTKVSTPEINELYDAAIEAGAYGGKLCGAGGGGFLLMVIPPERRAAFNERMQKAFLIPIDMDRQGSAILQN
ncbi:D-glycero-alpha-D-manno-heptose-7-phosphate kinase [Bosea sp. 62]|uniref:GHMP family kinase ATP-binding protein n=1 Tax=unclassified Bosea (in: a-proteobacteria) TaxID=2653178 RepID=UPI001259881A|nr:MULTISPECIES: GHMP kinase [unclassified Bosea (in: a-proteobacteria)]CAD5293012.1 D-glycero-alpha-D-manno-heptose-7-phosphate kinase [Bosea sp. 21B]CAD5293591.1 D-glycero-alpha-D-manno-heptose-7-phosphate kinase [Bosea sp. 46]CAD5299538.1 D-glycero-alpha-D-manno-heptose-7-phosphate kinase [Bosea sp. 7B]VVT62212.1 D-glycero-alpha-D-manno-heptose-7-phosphate kinase [Bosea sp. EC-HK365B]VXB09358.1 D-glycero-alpha-D-manno-heptose-7-phosphate kinase [Bosea sp. 125]